MSNTDVGKKKNLYIAEKPSVAKQFAEALGVNTNSSGRRGYIEAGEDSLTETEGVFTAGDCRTKAVRQLATAASDGAVAALAAVNYMNSHNL